MNHLFIINPISGNRNKSRIENLIRRDFLDARIEYTEKKGDATVFAKTASEDCVIAVGGDGTVHEVAEGVIGTDKILGIVPCGSGNGLARHLGISRNPRRALSAIKDRRIENIDFGYLNGMPFFCTCGVGLDASVSQRFSESKVRGISAYIKAALHIWHGYVPETYELNSGDKAIKEKAVIITIGNANQWGNNGLICPNASLSDGQLDVSIVKPFRLRQGSF